MPIIDAYDAPPGSWRSHSSASSSTVSLRRRIRHAGLICMLGIAAAIGWYCWHTNAFKSLRPAKTSSGKIDAPKIAPDRPQPESPNQYASKAESQRQAERSNSKPVEPVRPEKTVLSQQVSPQTPAHPGLERGTSEEKSVAPKIELPKADLSPQSNQHSQQVTPTPQHRAEINVEKPSQPKVEIVKPMPMPVTPQPGVQPQLEPKPKLDKTEKPPLLARVKPGVNPPAGRSRQGSSELTQKQMIEQEASKFESRKQWLETSRALSRLVAIEPSNLALRHRYGMALACAGQYRQAIPELERAIRNGKTDGPTWHYLAHSYGMVGSHSKALNAFQEAIRLQPNDYWHYKRGARLIVDASLVDPRFRRYLPLASQWYTRARQLGASEEELRPIRSLLEFHARNARQSSRPLAAGRYPVIRY